MICVVIGGIALALVWGMLLIIALTSDHDAAVDDDDL